jgi:septal ring factor EnvC (AmiA/AmiB activator)
VDGKTKMLPAMKKIPRYLIFLSLLLIILLLLANLFLPEQRAWKHNKKQVQQIRSNMDSAHDQVLKTTQLIDSLRLELNRSSAKMEEMSKKLEQLELERKSSQEKFKRESAQMKEKLKRLTVRNDSSAVPAVVIE